MSFDQLKAIIERFVIVYNAEHYHGAIGYVTPEQKHNGQAEKKRLARLHRVRVNHSALMDTRIRMARENIFIQLSTRRMGRPVQTKTWLTALLYRLSMNPSGVMIRALRQRGAKM